MWLTVPTSVLNMTIIFKCLQICLIIYSQMTLEHPRDIKLIILKPRMQHWGLGPIIFCLNDNPVMILTYFVVRSNLVSYAFYMRNIFRKKTFYERNLQQMTRCTYNACLYKYSASRRLSAIHMYMTNANMVWLDFH